MTKRLTVSDLVAAERCEAQFVFDRRFGNKRSADWRARAAIGRAAHAAYEVKAGLGLGPRDQRCFIATAAFGEDAPETNALRAFRDETLTGSPAGRFLMDFYYRLSPFVAQLIRRSTRLAALSRIVLRVVIAAVRRRS
jgi:hypothetical protein